VATLACDMQPVCDMSVKENYAVLGQIILYGHREHICLY